MSKLSLSLPILALCLTANSYAEVNNRDFMASDASKQCDYYYQEVLKEPLIKRNTAITIDKEAARDIEVMTKFADDYVMNVDIATFASSHRRDNYEDLISASNTITQSEAVYGLMQLFGAYFSGEYVPKDDYQAMTYLKKLVAYYKRERPEYVEELIFGVVGSFSDDISKKNPLWDDKDPKQIFKLLIKAGSIETEALLLDEDFRAKNADANCMESLLPKLERLAQRGSRLAIHMLADSYEDLNFDNSNKYKDKMIYWQKKAEENPLVGLKVGL